MRPGDEAREGELAADVDVDLLLRLVARLVALAHLGLTDEHEDEEEQDIDLAGENDAERAVAAAVVEVEGRQRWGGWRAQAGWRRGWRRRCGAQARHVLERDSRVVEEDRYVLAQVDRVELRLQEGHACGGARAVSTPGVARAEARAREHPSSFQCLLW